MAIFQLSSIRPVMLTFSFTPEVKENVAGANLRECGSGVGQLGGG